LRGIGATACDTSAGFAPRDQCPHHADLRVPLPQPSHLQGLPEHVRRVGGELRGVRRTIERVSNTASSMERLRVSRGGASSWPGSPRPRAGSLRPRAPIARDERRRQGMPGLDVRKRSGAPTAPHSPTSAEGAGYGQPTRWAAATSWSIRARRSWSPSDAAGGSRSGRRQGRLPAGAPLLFDVSPCRTRARDDISWKSWRLPPQCRVHQGLRRELLNRIRFQERDQPACWRSTGKR
jgi:hypothetical protein